MCTVNWGDFGHLTKVFPRILLYDLLKQYINITNDYNLLVQYVVLYVYHVFF